MRFCFILNFDIQVIINLSPIPLHNSIGEGIMSYNETKDKDNTNMAPIAKKIIEAENRRFTNYYKRQISKTRKLKAQCSSTCTPSTKRTVQENLVKAGIAIMEGDEIVLNPYYISKGD